LKPTQSSKHYSEIDFIRVFACFGIILYHFIHAEGYHFFRSFDFANGSWAHLLVSVFFAVSGFVLYQKYGTSKRMDVIAFYKKRAGGMLPLFWISYIYVLLIGLAASQLQFSLKPLWTWILTLCEMDGYLSARFETHYLIGEWFMGALIIVYLLFPLILKGIQKHPFVLLAVLVIADFAVDYYDIPTISLIYSNVTDCVLRVYMGMICAKYAIQNKRIWLAGSLIFLVIYTFVEIPYAEPVMLNAAGCALFIILFNAGSAVCRFHVPEKVISYIASLSYPVFLIHSATIEGVLLFLAPDSWLMFWLGYALIIIAALAQAVLLKWIDGKITFALTGGLKT